MLPVSRTVPLGGMNSDKRLEANFHVGSRHFVVKAQGKRLSIFSDDGALVHAVRLPLDGSLRNLRIGRNGWLWIEADGGDLVTRISSGPPASIGEMRQMTELKQERCSRIANWLGECKSARGQYSQLLQSVFVTGYAVGSDKLVTVEIRDGHHRTLPFSPVDGGYVSEYPALRGLVFRSHDNGLIFYGGQALVPIAVPGLASRYRVIDAASDPSGRVFASRSEFPDTERVYLSELLPDGQAKDIKMPERLPGWWLPTFFDFPPDRVAFAFTRYSLGAIVNGEWRSLAVTRHDDYIHGPADIGKSPDGNIHFMVRKKGDKGASIDAHSSMQFVLRRVVGSSRCPRPLGLQAPLQLGHDV